MSNPNPLEDFRVFLTLVWEHLGLPPPTQRQLEIAHYLQHGPRRSIIQAFRGVGKSWITSAFVVWCLLLNPTLNIVVVSASKSRSDDFSTFTMRLIQDMPILRSLQPRGDQRNSKISFDVGPAPASHQPSVKSFGITGMMTGSRADLIIADDIETPLNSATQAQRDKLYELVKEFDAILKPNGSIKYLGTPQNELSLYAELTNRGYQTLIWPARFPNAAWMKANGPRLAPRLAREFEEHPELSGSPTDAGRFDDEDLIERELSYGKSGFALQFMLDTSLSDAEKFPLRCSDLIVMPFPGNNLFPEQINWSSDPDRAWPDLQCVGLRGDRFYRPYGDPGNLKAPTGSMMFIDPSGRGKDETSIAVVKFLNGNLFWTVSKGYRDGYSLPVLSDIAKVAKDEEVNLIKIEKNFGDGMFAQLLRPVLDTQGVNVTIEDVHANIQKEKRIIDTLEPVMNSHRLIVDKALIANDLDSTKDLPADEALKYMVFYQMTRITRERGALQRDDRLDALAGAVQHWVEFMSMDDERAVALEKRKLFEAELKLFTAQAKKQPGVMSRRITGDNARSFFDNPNSISSMIPGSR